MIESVYARLLYLLFVSKFVACLFKFLKHPSSPGALELQEIAENLPGLIYKPGVSSWILASKELEIYKTFDEVPEALHNQTRPRMFPPKPEEADKFHLDRWWGSIFIIKSQMIRFDSDLKHFCFRVYYNNFLFISIVWILVLLVIFFVLLLIYCWIHINTWLQSQVCFSYVLIVIFIFLWQFGSYFIWYSCRA